MVKKRKIDCWIDEASELPCLILLGRMGEALGYVGVPRHGRSQSLPKKPLASLLSEPGPLPAPTGIVILAFMLRTVLFIEEGRLLWISTAFHKDPFFVYFQIA